MCCSLPSFVEKVLEVELWTSNQQKENESCIGRAFVPIRAICEGPFHIDYQLLNNKFCFRASFINRKQPCGRISFNCTIEQQCVWGLRFSRATARLRDEGDLDLNEGNLWSLVVSMTKNEGEELYHSSDTSIPVVTNEVAELDADKKVAEIGPFSSVAPAHLHIVARERSLCRQLQLHLPRIRQGATEAAIAQFGGML